MWFGMMEPAEDNLLELIMQNKSNSKSNQQNVENLIQVVGKDMTDLTKEKSGEIEQGNQAEEMGKPKKKFRWKKILMALVFTILITGVLLFYGNIAIYYQTHFFPNTFINGYDCSNLDVATVAIFLENQAKEYSIEVIGRDAEGQKVTMGVLRAGDFGLSLVDVEKTVGEILEQQNELLWIATLSKDLRSYSLVQGTTFDKEMLKTALGNLEALQEMHMIAPENAHISEYSEEEQRYEIIPETMGTTVNIEAAVECVDAAIRMKEAMVDLEMYGCYQTAEITSQNKKLQKSVETVNQWLQTDITYDWNGSEVKLDADVIKDWISFTEEELPKPKLDETAVADFVAEQAKEYDTYGKSRKFVTSRGVELTLPSGAYGWKTDQESEAKELTELIYQGSILEREPIYLKKAAQKGRNDIGSSYVEADLTYQHLYLYKDGVLVLETDFVSGDMNVANNITPQGVFGITYKTTNAVLRGADYETPVTYWMPFHGNFGMHDATWRTEFGGTIYLTNGSHGCINLPLDKAAAIYQYVSTGFPVICYYY